MDQVLATDAAAVFNATFHLDIDLSNISDPYVASPLLQAIQRCVDGPPELQDVPSWLYYGLGRLQVVSIDSATPPATPMASTPTAETELRTLSAGLQATSLSVSSG